MKILKTNFLVIAILLMLGAPAFAFTAGELTSYQNAQNLSTSGAYAVSGNIGINTTAPRGTLEVDGTTYLMSGNVGVGTTGPRAQLEVGTAASVTAGANAAAIIKNDLVVDGKIYGDASQLTNLPAGISGLNAGYLSRANTSTSIIDSGIYQDAAGNIGIGTTGPVSAFELGSGQFTLPVTGSVSAPQIVMGSQVGGLAGIYSDSANYIRFVSVGSRVLSIGPGGVQSQMSSGFSSAAAPQFTFDAASTTGLFLPAAGTLGFSQSGIESMRITSSGNVGIGTTAPRGLLEVDGTTYLMSGNVGIGTTAPGAPLQVSSVFTYGLASKDLILIEPMFSGATMGVPSTHGGIAWGAPGTPLGRIQLVQDDPSNYFTSHLEFWTHDGATISEKMRLAGNGNVGIGTTGPIGSLEVDGNVYVKNASVGIGTSAPAAALDMGTGGIRLGGVTNTTWPSATSQWSGTSGSAIYYNSANVGIGTTGPAAALDMGAGGIRLGGVTNTSWPSGSSQWSGTIGSAISYNSANVGIGSAAPQQKLDVEGTVYFGNGNVGVDAVNPRQKLQVVGNFEVSGASSGAKSYRFRTDGGALDFEASGTSMYYSVWSSADYGGLQRNYMILDSGGHNATAMGDWNFWTGNSPWGANPVLSIQGESGGNVGISTTAPVSTLQIQGSFAVYRTGTAGDVSSAGQSVIGVTDTTSARTITLATADMKPGRIMIIKDETGAAATHNITVATQGTEKIDGQDTITITANYGVLRVYSDGSNWFTF